MTARTMKPRLKADGTASRDKNPVRAVAASVWGRLMNSARAFVRAAVIRLATLLAAYVLVFSTAFGVIPMIGMFLHQQSGADDGELTFDGVLAVWVVPFVFVVGVLFVAETAILRWLWRAGSRRIDAFRTVHRPGTPDASGDGKPVRAGGTPRTKTARK
ncbi:hypothetical protein KKI43_23260 [Arthrobacter sp. GN70]|nr:hypothetical protein [Arthrobacter sp. GN70]